MSQYCYFSKEQSCDENILANKSSVFKQYKKNPRFSFETPFLAHKVSIHDLWIWCLRGFCMATDNESTRMITFKKCVRYSLTQFELFFKMRNFSKCVTIFQSAYYFFKLRCRTACLPNREKLPTLLIINLRNNKFSTLWFC